MDNISMYLMVIASSTYADLGLKFRSSQPSTATVGTIAELSGLDSSRFSQTQPSTATVGTIAQVSSTVTSLFESVAPSSINVGTIAQVSSTVTSLFESATPAEMSVGTTAIGEVINSVMFETNPADIIMIAGPQTTSTLNATHTTMFVADNVTVSEMYRELTQEELNPTPPAAPVDTYFASTSLLINGE